MIGRFMGINFKVSSNEKGKKVKTFKNASRSVSGRYATHEIIRTKPKKEFLGPGLMTSSLTMELDGTMGVNPTIEEAKLKAAIENGESSLLIIGAWNKGRYTINSMSAAYDVVIVDGKILKMTISLELEEYR